jgi:hypothetical protein
MANEPNKEPNQESNRELNKNINEKPNLEPNKEQIAYNQMKKRMMLISHHPVCDHYIDHTIKIKGHNFCIGCYVGYPSGVLGWIFVYFVIIYELLHPWVLLGMELGLMMGFTLSLTKLTKNKKIKILQKFIVGFGAGMFIGHFYITYPGNDIARVLLTLMGISVLNTPMLLLHVRNHNKICDLCQYEPGWGRCPGYP